MNTEKFDRIVEFSPEMSAYRKELKKALEGLDRIGAQGLIFDKVLLVSIDEGWGYSELVEMISYELKVAFDLEHRPIEKEEESYITDKREESWRRQYDRIENIGNKARHGSKFAILTYDLTTVGSELGTPEFMRRICDIKEHTKDTLLIFRVPYMSQKALTAYEQAFDDALAVRVLSVPPVSVENMVIYVREKLQSVGVSIDSGCDDLLEQWICQEKSDGVFRGYQTLDKMVTEILYQKAISVNEGELLDCSMEYVGKADIQNMLDNPLVAENAYELLDELIGMTQLKTSIREVVAQIKLQRELKEEGKDVEEPSLHMLFLGNPGTGKTTVARIIGKIFKQENLLRKGHFIEMRGSSFVVGNVNTTMEKVRSTCRDSYGSVLFIDEAYGMSVGHSNGNVTDEILPILVAEMENHRDEMCVIFAGYKEEMENFLKANSGLKSRIPHVLEFPNYTRDELMEIFFKMVEGRFEYEEELKDTLQDYIQNIPDTSFQTKEFSNARFIRNLYERLWGKAAYRISQSGEKEIVLKKEDMLCVVQEEDFQTMVTEKNRKQIGFAVK
ncbi:MAG: AAA family ATPase [Tyzzerella sp.]|nr:AAA family ATPase [Tyzzerella sp.]